MIPTHPNSREHFQQAIDAEIKSSENSESIRALKSRRNTHSPVSSLPPEVFAIIFSFLCLPGVPSLGGNTGQNPTRLHISQVCQQWREMALRQPLLWSHINFDTLSSAGVSEILVRTKLVPLYLEAKVSNRYWDDVKIGMFQKELQSLVPRICHLRITVDSMSLPSTLEGLVSPAPTLEYLSVFCLLFSSDEIETIIPDNLFDGCTPRLSCLELLNCDIRWESPLLKGLRYLKIKTLSDAARPQLAVWLDALREMPQLKALTLHSASPISPSSSSNVERTLTLSSLTLLDITDTPQDCVFALAHLDVPALTCLRLTVFSSLYPNYCDVQDLLPYVMRHAHIPQDAHPLQTVLISSYERDYENYLVIAAWTVPDIDAEVHHPPALLGTTIPPRIALAFESGGELYSGAHCQMLDTVLAALPLDDLVMLAVQDPHMVGYLAEDLSRQQFWLRNAPQWPLLQRVRVARPVTRGFLQALLEDNGGREKPMLPSLTELVVDRESSNGLSHLPICDTLMKRVEQGVPLDMLDLRTCQYDTGSFAAVQSFSEIVINVLGPDPEARKRITSMWDALACGPFTEDGISG